MASISNVQQSNIFGDNVIKLATELVTSRGLPLTNGNVTTAILGLQNGSIQPPQQPQILDPTRLASGYSQPFPESQPMNLLGDTNPATQPQATPNANPPVQSQTEVPSNPAQPAATGTEQPMVTSDPMGGLAKDAMAGVGAAALAWWMAKQSNPNTPPATPEVQAYLASPQGQQMIASQSSGQAALPPPEEAPLDKLEMRQNPEWAGRGRNRRQVANNPPQVPEGATQLRGRNAVRSEGSQPVPVKSNAYPMSVPLEGYPIGSDELFAPNVERAGDEPIEIRGNPVLDYETNPLDENTKVYKVQKPDGSVTWTDTIGNEIPPQYLDPNGNIRWQQENLFQKELYEFLDRARTTIRAIR